MFAPSLENDHLYDATSYPTSTQVNTAITDMETILEAIRSDAPQAVKDVIIKEIIIDKLNKLTTYLKAQGKKTLEPGEVPIKVTLDDLRPIHLQALNGSMGKTYPRFSVMPLR